MHNVATVKLERRFDIFDCTYIYALETYLCVHIYGDVSYVLHVYAGREGFSV